MPKYPYKQMGNDLNRFLRNDYNQNLKDIESDIKELGAAPAEALDAAHEANVQANYAKEQGDYAGSKGDYAANNGDYAKQQGDYAKEQGDYAKNSTDVIINEANKAVQNAEDAVKNANQAINNSNIATENANKASNNANEKAKLANDKAVLAQEKIAIMDSLESSLNNTLVQANEKINETVVAITNSNEATANANKASNEANQSAQLADEKANLAQEKVDSLSSLETALNAEMIESKQATLDAKQATESANKAATTATNNGTYAKTQGDYAKEQGDKVQDIIDGTGFIPTSEKGKPSGVATLDENGKVLSNQLNIYAPPDASTNVKGVVMLEDSTTSTSITKAATPNSIKKVNDAVISHLAGKAQDDVHGIRTYINNLQIGGRNLLKDSNRFSINPYKYSRVSVSKYFTVEEWGAEDTSKITLYEGDDIIKGILTTGLKAVPGFTYVMSVYIKNVGIAPITISPNSGSNNVTVQPAESTKVVLFKDGNSQNTIQFNFMAPTPSDSLEFFAWHAQVQVGTKETDWTPAPEDVDSIVGKLNNLKTATKDNLVSAINETFQFANNGKKDIASVIGFPATSEDTFSQLKAHIQNAKIKGATNLTNKEISSSETESLDSLMSKIDYIVTGKRFATGQVPSVSYGDNKTVSSLGFNPSVVHVWYYYDATYNGEGTAAKSKLPNGGIISYRNKINIYEITNDSFTFNFQVNISYANVNWIAIE